MRYSIPPVIDTDSLAFQVDENTTAAGQLSATDDDTAASGLTWSLASEMTGADDEEFVLSSTGMLTFLQGKDFEVPDDADADGTYKVMVQVSDGDSTAVALAKVTLADVDEPPVITGVTIINDYDENGTGNVATYTAADPEGDSNITWSLDGPDRGDFDIAGGVLTFQNVPDHERPADSGGNNQYEVAVQATDSNNNRGEVQVDVIVTNVDEPPELTGPDTADDFPENSATSRQVGRYTASDPESATVTLSLTGADGDEFTLASNGVLTFRESPDYEEQRSFSVTVMAGAGSHTVDKVVTVNIQNVEEPGTVTLSAVQPQTGTPLTAMLDDDDGPTSTTWQWYRTSSRGSAGAAIAHADSRFYTPVDGDVGSYLRAVASYDDGHGTGKSSTAVSANRVQEAPPEPEPPVFPADGEYDRSIRENQRAGRHVGAPVTATDGNNDRLTYTISTSDEFEILASPGQLRTKAELDHEGQEQHFVTVTATDPGGLTATISVTITVEDVDETPVVTGPNSPEVAENSNTNVSAYTSTDPDEKGIEWVLTGMDSDAFILSVGVLTFSKVPNYEEKNQYRVTVEAREQGNGTSVGRLNVTVRVTNVDEDATLESNTNQPRVDQQLTLELNDEDGGESIKKWKWERGDPNSPCGTVGSPSVTHWGLIPGATRSSYAPTAADEGKCIRATVFYNDRAGTGKSKQYLTAMSVVVAPHFQRREMTLRVRENTATGQHIGSPVRASHPYHEGLTYSLGGVDAVYFSLDPSTGQLQAEESFDYESPSDSDNGNDYEVTVTARDEDGDTDSIDVTVNVTDVCEAPARPGAPAAPSLSTESSSSLGVTWSAPASGSCISGYDLQYRQSGGSWSSPVSAGASRTYTLTGLSPGATYEVQVRARNALGPGGWSAPATESPPPPPPPPRRRSAGGGGGGGGGGAPPPTNRPPVFAEGANTVRSVPEYTRVGTAIGARVAATDADRDSLTYTVRGIDGGSFTVDRSSGQLRARAVLDLSAKPRHAVLVVVSDAKGGRAVIAVTIIVTEADLGDRYDADDNGTIDKDEATAAVVDYFGDLISKDALIEVIKLYFFS